jgi:hypothetical protein
MPHGWMLVNDGYGCGYGEGPVDFPQDLSDLTYVDLTYVDGLRLIVT